jgi:hypothetical protein
MGPASGKGNSSSAAESTAAAHILIDFQRIQGGV